MDNEKLQAWWAHKQGLDGRLKGEEAGEVLARTGWARSVGGASPYLTLFARAGLSRAEVDAAVAKVEIHELPAARGCTYVVGAKDYALALRAGWGFGYEPEMKVARKLGVTDGEVEKLADGVVAALEKGAKSPDELKEALGGKVRNLGPEGVKKGVTTTLPLALGKLQTEGEIRRVPMNGRLDQQRYRYAVWKENPLRKYKLSQEEVNGVLARRYFEWIGPATVGEFQWFSAFGAKAAKAAVAEAGVLPVEEGSDLLIGAEDREALAAFERPKNEQYALVSSLDGITLLKRNAKELLSKKDQERQFFVEKGYAAGGTLADLPNHAIVDRGRVVGLWEFDVAENAIVWTSFVGKSKGMAAAVKETEEYVREQLGDARSFSLDSPKSRVGKIEALRKMG